MKKRSGLSQILALAGALMPLCAQAAVFRADYDLDGDGLIEIYTLAELDQLRGETLTPPVTLDGVSDGCDPCTGYELMNDLDFDTDGSGSVDAADDYWNVGAGWDPIDDLEATFDGNGFTIANLYIDRDEPNLGLFGSTIFGSEITNLKLTGVDINGAAVSVGAVVGWSLSAVSDCEVQGSITVSTNAAWVRAGGVAGYSGAGIDGCSADIVINGTDVNTQIVSLGGIAGYAEGSAGVSNSTATGTITGSGLNSFYAAGIVGFNSDGPVTRSVSSVSIEGSNSTIYFAIGGVVGLSANSGAIVEESSSSGTLTGLTPSSAATSVGGIVGYAYGNISKSFSSATVSASGGTGTARAGGIAGGAGAISITDVYATGTVTSVADSSASAGGILGQSNSTSVARAYAIGELTGSIEAGISSGGSTDSYYLASISGGTPGPEALTEAYLKCPISPGDETCPEAVYTNWTTDTWDFGTSEQYPALIIAGKVTRDSDGDGVIDEDDAFPDNAAASVDVDEDGKPDEWNADCDVTCQDSSGLTLDDLVGASEVVTLDELLSGDGDDGGAIWHLLIALALLGWRRARYGSIVQ